MSLLAGVTILGMPMHAAHAQPVAAAVQAASDPYAAFIAEAAQRFAIPAAWIRAVMRVESRGVARVVSPKGAMGLMQLMPETWTTLQVRYGLGPDAFDPHDNILAGAAFLREMHDRYGAPGFLAAYNAGPGRYEDYHDRHRPLPPETLAYVAALAPVIGGVTMHNVALPVAASPPSWRQASLFIVRSASADPVFPTTDKLQTGERPTVVAVRDVSAIVPQSAGLFVAISAAGAKP